jgi:hypothetical protein
MVSDPHKDQPFEPVENAGFTSNDLQLTSISWGKIWENHDPSDFSFWYHVDHHFPQMILVDHPCGIPTGTRWIQMDPVGTNDFRHIRHKGRTFASRSQSRCDLATAWPLNICPLKSGPLSPLLYPGNISFTHLYI